MLLLSRADQRYFARNHADLSLIADEATQALRTCKSLDGGIAASFIIGALAGLVPAIRAARLPPAQAVWSV